MEADRPGPGGAPDAPVAGYSPLPRQRAAEPWGYAGHYPAPQPGYPPQYRPASTPPPPGPPARGPRAATVFRVALITALAVLVLAPPAAIAFTTVRQERATTMAGQGLSGGSRDAAGKPNAGPGRSAGAGASRGPAPSTVDGKIKAALEDQGAALLAGDQEAFLSVVDPSATKLREDLTRRFASLRQLQVKLWQPALEEKPKTEAGGTATATVYVKYCYVVVTCDPMNFESATRWSTAGKSVTLLEFGTSTDLGPRPWEVSELRTAVGNRVVLSTTAKYAARLPALLAAAEKAAALTDTFARWNPPPSRYVVYLAGPEEWSSWYGIKQESWVAGFALPLTSNATEIVLNAARVDTKQTLDVLRHEFTHVVTLANVDKAYDKTWWLVEGIAEYVRVKGGGRAFDGQPDVRAYLRSGHWKNDIALDDPPPGSTTADVSGRYGVAYLSLQRLADRFGEDRMLDFFNFAARQGQPLDTAAQQAFGVGWADVEADCVRSVRAHT